MGEQIRTSKWVNPGTTKDKLQTEEIRVVQSWNGWINMLVGVLLFGC